MIKIAIRNILKGDARVRLIKAQPEQAFNVLLMRLETLLKRHSNEVLSGAVEHMISVTRATDNVRDALRSINDYLHSLPEQAVTILRPQLYAITKEVWTVGFSLAFEGDSSLRVGFNLKDIDAMNWLGTHNIYWIKKHYDELTGQKLNSLVMELFE